MDAANYNVYGYTNGNPVSFFDPDGHAMSDVLLEVGWEEASHYTDPAVRQEVVDIFSPSPAAKERNKKRKKTKSSKNAKKQRSQRVYISELPSVRSVTDYLNPANLSYEVSTVPPWKQAFYDIYWAEVFYQTAFAMLGGAGVGGGSSALYQSGSSLFANAGKAISAFFTSNRVSKLTPPGNNKLKMNLQAFAKKPSAKGLYDKDFEDFLTKHLGGNGSFSKGGRDFDGGIGNRWWEAKSGPYWENRLKDPKSIEKFKSDMGSRLKIAKDHGATYELHSNSSIPQIFKDYLNKKGIPYHEWLD